jgi:hypothetical protein
MGRVVVVEKVMVRYRKGDERSWIVNPCHLDRAGWVVGFRTLRNGHMCQNDYDSTDEVWFQPSHSIECVLVAFWPTMKPVKVPLDGFRVDPSARPGAPSYDWTEKDREALRKEVLSAPRDKKGRWAPMG